MPERIKSGLDWALSRILVGIMAVLLLDVVWQVITRYALGDPSSFTDELARFLLIWIALLGAAYVTGQRGHIAIDLLSQQMGQAISQWITSLCIIIFSTSVMIVGGIRWVLLTLELEQRSAALQIPLGYVYLVLPLSGFCMLLYSVIQLIQKK